jgi:imidazolonepropionase-like amidohydrolase
MLGAMILATPAFAETIAITNGKVALGDGSAPIDGATVVIANGRIAAAGRGVAVPAGATVVDAAGKWVVPGFVAGFTRMGLTEVDGVDETNDTSARTSPFGAAIDVSTSINPRASSFAVSRQRGVTRAVVAPSTAAGMFAGQGAVIDLANDMDAVTKPRAFQYVEFGEQGADDSGGSRPAAHVYFRNALREAEAYARNPAGYDGRSKDALTLRVDAAALVPVVRGQMPLLVHVERAADILGVLDLKREFPALKLVLVGAAEGWTVADRIAAARVPVIANAMTDLPAAFEQLAATQSNVGRLSAAGVITAIGMLNEDESHMARVTSQLAGNMVALTKIPGAGGLDWGHALAAVTSRPAEAIGMGGQMGVLKAGAHGDVVVWDGDPLELSSSPVAMWIDGVAQPLTSRQTRLRDRYRSLAPEALPRAYDH